MQRVDNLIFSVREIRRNIEKLAHTGVHVKYNKWRRVPENFNIDNFIELLEVFSFRLAVFMEYIRIIDSKRLPVFDKLISDTDIDNEISNLYFRSKGIIVSSGSSSLSSSIFSIGSLLLKAIPMYLRLFGFEYDDSRALLPERSLGNILTGLHRLDVALAVFQETHSAKMRNGYDFFHDNAIDRTILALHIDTAIQEISDIDTLPLTQQKLS